MTDSTRGAGRPDNTEDKFDEEARRAFLYQLEQLGEFTAAAACVGVSYDTVLRYRREHPEFELACKRARGRLFAEVLLSARKLAIDGVSEVITDRDGKVIGNKKKFDGRMILAWLQRMERQWAQRVDVVEREGQPEGLALKAAEYTLDDLSAATRAKLRAVAAEEVARAAAEAPAANS